MSTKNTSRHTEPPREVWIGFDAADSRGDMTGIKLVSLRAAEAEAEEEALAAEARRTGILVSIALPTGFLIAWLIDLATGGPGLAAMVGL